MKKITLLTDYQNRFGSKHNDSPYRSGFDKKLLVNCFNEYGYEPIFRNFAEIDFSKENFKNELVLYTSSEDDGYYYKAFIEDVVLGLDLQGAKVIPEFKFLRANNNKVFMEILRNQLIGNSGLKASYYGTFEELENYLNNIIYPVVIKTSEGASGTGVFLAKSKYDLVKIAKKIARTRNVRYELWDYGRSIKHNGYIRDSVFRKKFIIQDFIPDLKNDWKVLVYGEKYFVLKRENRQNDFRASGSGLFSFVEELPSGLLNFARDLTRKFNLPQISLDIASNGKDFFLIEFQAVYFGTYTLENSSFYFAKVNDKWELFKCDQILEVEYVYSLVNFMNNLCP